MDYNKEVRNASIFGIIGNILLLIFKLVVGILFKSKAIIADCVNSAGDIFASFMAFIGNKISSQPADDDHNMGHGKAEYMFSLFIGLGMIVASFIVIYNCFQSLIHSSSYEFSWYMVYVCLFTIIVKICLYLYSKRKYQTNKSILLKSLYIDHRNDVFVTSSIIVSIIFAFFNIYIVDSIVGILISIWIIYNGFNIFLDSYNVLMDKSLNEKEQNLIKETILEYEDVLKMGSFSSIPIGNKYVLVLTIFVKPDMKVKKAHELTKILQEEIIKKISVVDRVIIHVNPLD